MSPTDAGERLLNAIGNRFDEIEKELDALTELRDKPAGTVRITCGDFCLHSILLPKFAPLLRAYPDIKVEFDVNLGFCNIVADRFDAGGGLLLGHVSLTATRVGGAALLLLASLTVGDGRRLRPA